MLSSYSTYFHQSKERLIMGRSSLVKYLEIWNYNFKQIEIYLKAYDYFCSNPDDFDGATIVKDLCHIPGLDINAMLHDYMYLVCNAGASFRTKNIADWIYAKEMEKMGKGQLAWIRFSLLKITGGFFILYARIKRGKPRISQFAQIVIDEEILLNT